MLSVLSSVASVQSRDGIGQNNFRMFPGKATWGPSPLAGGSLDAGIGSPGELQPDTVLARPETAKVVATSVGVSKIKMGFPPFPSAPHIPSRHYFPPIPVFKEEPDRPVSRLLVIKAGISGDSPFVITRQQRSNIMGSFGSISRPVTWPPPWTEMLHCPPKTKSRQLLQCKRLWYMDFRVAIGLRYSV